MRINHFRIAGLVVFTTSMALSLAVCTRGYGADPTGPMTYSPTGCSDCLSDSAGIDGHCSAAAAEGQSAHVCTTDPTTVQLQQRKQNKTIFGCTCVNNGTVPYTYNTPNNNGGSCTG